MRIGIIGARLSGSYAGLLLARMGHDVLLFDPDTTGEKPCGGGVTAKAWSSISWLRGCNLPHTVITFMRLWSSDSGWTAMRLRQPILVFARSTLDRALLEDALRAGARLIPERALGFERARPGWAVRTAHNSYEVEFLIGADGAKSTVRRALAGGFGVADLSFALGYYLPGRFHPDTILVAFQKRDFMGYLWSFPRIDHISVGIVRRLHGAAAADLKARVEGFIEDQYPRAGRERRLYAACIPCLSRRRFRHQRVAGPDWALVGDAAGFADPVTGEGIYYALRSAELLARALAGGGYLEYESSWRRDFGPDLARAAAWRDRFYGGVLLARSCTGIATALAGRSPAAAKLIERAVSSPQGYRGIPASLLVRSPLILLQCLRNRSACRPAAPPIS